ncbi:MAG: IS66 family insertion sequence element accessory protein TnpB [Gammaproteobacteria bacterium]|nr:IS66 family insertion sequence element accessory protein TnpB [Gammaproteobacteria bacterium]
MVTRIRRSPEQWQQIINQQHRSGLSATRFCQQELICYPVFRKWLVKLEAADEPAPLLDLSDLIASRQPATWDIELELGDGVVLRLRRP